MPVDHRLDLLGVNFQTADIDDAAAAPGEQISIATQFNHVTGIDEAVSIRERCVGADIAGGGARRPDAQRAVKDFNLDTVANLFDEFRRKAGKPVTHFEDNAGFGRSIGVADHGIGKRFAQVVENRLVGDLAG